MVMWVIEAEERLLCLFDLGRLTYSKEDFSGSLQAPAAPVEQVLCGKPSVPGRTGHKPVRKPGVVSQVVF